MNSAASTRPVEKDTGVKKRPRRAPVSVGTVFWAVLAGTLVGISTIVFIYQLVFLYHWFARPGTGGSAAAEGLATGLAPAVFFCLGAALAAFAVVRRGGHHGVAVGALAGVAAAVSMQLIVYLEYPPVLILEVAWYLTLGLSGGAVGGWLGEREALRGAASEKALLSAMEEMACAGSADEVAAAVATSVGRGELAGVGVWRNVAQGPGAPGSPDGVFDAEGRGRFSCAELLRSVGRTTAEEGVRIVRIGSLANEAQRTWRGQGVHSAFMAPLNSLSGKSLGFLFVGFRKEYPLFGGSKRRVLSAAAGAWLALEKLAAAKKEREQEKRVGMMEERERVSREIHDSLIQCLAGITMELDGARRAEQSGAAGIAWPRVGRARDAARRATGEARRLVRAMRPEVLDGSSLPEALAVLAQRLEEESGIETRIRVIGEARPLEPEEEHALTRVTQEALSNVRKHSGASCAFVSLRYHPGRVTLDIEDDGAGLENSPSRSEATEDDYGGFGMRSMRERAQRCGGQLTVDSFEGAGTTITVELPTHEDELSRSER